MNGVLQKGGHDALDRQRILSSPDLVFQGIDEVEGRKEGGGFVGTGGINDNRFLIFDRNV